MFKKLAIPLALVLCLTGCSLQPSLLSESKVVEKIQESIPNATHIETNHELHPQTPNETCGMNTYLFSTGEFAFQVRNYLSYYFGPKNPENEVQIEYDAELMRHLEPQFQTVLTDCGFDYQFADNTPYERTHNAAILHISNQLSMDNPYLYFYVNPAALDADFLLRIQSAITQMADILEPYLADEIKLQDTISIGITIHTTDTDTLHPSMHSHPISLEKKHFKQDIKHWAELTLVDIYR